MGRARVKFLRCQDATVEFFVDPCMQVGYGLVGDLAALAARLGRQDPVAAAAPALDVGAVHRALYLRRVPGVRKVGRAGPCPVFQGYGTYSP